MKPLKSNHIILTFALLALFVGIHQAVFAQGTAFTYQGQLQNNGSPASGLYDLRFTVWDAPTNGNLVAGPLTNSATGVTNGLFAVTLDFGSGVFTGPARWLELDARTNGSGAFTTLLPFQQLTPTPYAIFANTASNLSGTLSASQLSGTIPATNLTGTVSLAQLPAAVVTNNDTSISLSGTFSGNGAGLTGIPGTVSWQNVTGTNQQAQSNIGYLANNTSQVTITLPTSPNVGDIVRVAGVGAGGWEIAQSAGQSIQAAGFGGSTNWNTLIMGWTMASPPRLDGWRSIASSADGTKLAAAADSVIYTSANSGGTWTQTSVPTTNIYWCIASSADGTKLAAGTGGPFSTECNGIWTSANSGGTWTQTSAPITNWFGIASSADGTKLAAVAGPNGIWTSTNSGSTWTQTSAPTTNYICITSSADGTKLAAGAGNYYSGIYTSTNSGVTWTQQIPNGGGWWSCIASSADGTKLAAGDSYGEQIVISTNSGVTWNDVSVPSGPWGEWYSIASSADGTKLAAAAYYNAGYSPGGTYISLNAGATWTQTSAATNLYWNSIASSADGTKLAATAFQGGIWTAHAIIQTTTTPGTAGYLAGGLGSAIELLYIGNGLFMPLSYVGTISAH